MKRVAVAACLAGCLIVGAATTIAAAGAQSDPAARALTQQLVLIDAERWGRLYPRLHSTQRAFMTRQRFIDCRRQKALLQGDVTIDNIEILQIIDERITIPGTDQDVDSRAVTVRITGAVSGRDFDSTDTAHEINENGKWRFTDPGGDDYLDGRCPR